MEFINAIDHPADVFRTAIGEDDLLAAVVCKPSFVIEGEELVANFEDPWPIGPSPVEKEYGVFDGELPFYRRGVDVIVVGNSYAPRGEAVPELDVEVTVGSVLSRRIRVFGDRHWHKHHLHFVITEPEPFTSMPLTYERAFGGACEMESGTAPFGPNPVGRGLVLDKKEAEGVPLPNLENPEDLIREWDDRPDPVGFGPYARDWALRVMNGVELDLSDPEQPRLKRILPTLFNNAHPRMIIEDPRELCIGDLVRVTNVRPDTNDGALAFRVPPLRMHIHVQLEDRHRLYPLYPEQIIVLADEMRVVLSYRVVFKYTIIPMERRYLTLHEGAVPAEIPEPYVIDPDLVEALP